MTVLLGLIMFRVCARQHTLCLFNEPYPVRSIYFGNSRAGHARHQRRSCNLRIIVLCCCCFANVTATGVTYVITMNGQRLLSVTVTHRQMITLCFQAWWACLAVGWVLQMWSLAPHCFRATCGETTQGHLLEGFDMTVPNHAEERSLLCCQTRGVFLAMCIAPAFLPSVSKNSRLPIQTQTLQSPVERDLEPADFSKLFTHWNVTGPRDNFFYHLRSALCTSAVFIFMPRCTTSFLIGSGTLHWQLLIGCTVSNIS